MRTESRTIAFIKKQNYNKIKTTLEIIFACCFCAQGVIIFRFFLSPATLQRLSILQQTQHSPLLGSPGNQVLAFFYPACGQTMNILPALLISPFCIERSGVLFGFYYYSPLTPAQLLSFLFATPMLWKTLPDEYFPCLKATEQSTLLPKASSNLVETTAAGQGEQVAFATTSAAVF